MGLFQVLFCRLAAPGIIGSTRLRCLIGCSRTRSLGSDRRPNPSAKTSLILETLTVFISGKFLFVVPPSWLPSLEDRCLSAPLIAGRACYLFIDLFLGLSVKYFLCSGLGVIAMIFTSGTLSITGLLLLLDSLLFPSITFSRFSFSFDNLRPGIPLGF
jgi:hypothetical protein